MTHLCDLDLDLDLSFLLPRDTELPLPVEMWCSRCSQLVLPDHPPDHPLQDVHAALDEWRRKREQAENNVRVLEESVNRSHPRGHSSRVDHALSGDSLGEHRVPYNFYGGDAEVVCCSPYSPS